MSVFSLGLIRELLAMAAVAAVAVGAVAAASVEQDNRARGRAAGAIKYYTICYSTIVMFTLLYFW